MTQIWKLAGLAVVGFALGSAAQAQEDAEHCDLANYKGPAYQQSSHLYFRGMSEFKPVKRWDEVAQDLSIIPTNGYTLMEDLTFDGEVKGSLDAGTVFEYINTNEGIACTIILGTKGRPYMCLVDKDGDQTFDTGVLSSSAYSKKKEEIALPRPEIFVSNTKVAAQAKEISDLPHFTIVYGRGIQVRKVSKKYIKLSYGAAIVPKSRMTEKTRKRCGEICMAFNGGYVDEKIYYKDLKPVQFGGVTVHFKMGDDGQVLLATEGTFEPLEITRSCIGDEMSGGGIRMNRNFRYVQVGDTIGE